jgi:hypothetical protein
MDERTLALIGATFVALIYGANFTITKRCNAGLHETFWFIFVRALGGMILFWIFFWS